MRKIVLFFAILCTIALSGCVSRQQSQDATISSTHSDLDKSSISPVPSMENTDSFAETSAPDPFAQSNLSDEWIKIYWDKFSTFYSVDQYLDLCNIMNGMSAKPERAVNSNLFLAIQDLSTYDSINKKALLLNTSGEVIREYDPDFESDAWVFVPSSYRIGDYSIVSKDKYFEKDVFNDSGEFIGSFDVHDGAVDIVLDIGDGYYVFAPVKQGAYSLQLINPNGEVFYVKAGRDTPTYVDFENGAIAVGNLSDEVFSVRFDSIGNTYAYYFDVTGEVAIDLSANITNFKVTEMGEFKNEQATIYFTGIDNRKYSGIIDKMGAFIEEPKPIS